jgi:hypothetical protein
MLLNLKTDLSVLRLTAIRETFVESGVLLVKPQPGTLPGVSEGNFLT